MIVTLPEVKQYLRLELEHTEDDQLLETMVSAAEEYLFSATGKEFISSSPRAKLLVLVLVAEWYENREAIGHVSMRLKDTVRSLLLQLKCEAGEDDCESWQT